MALASKVEVARHHHAVPCLSIASAEANRPMASEVDCDHVSVCAREQVHAVCNKATENTIDYVGNGGNDLRVLVLACARQHNCHGRSPSLVPMRDSSRTFQEIGSVYVIR